MGSGASQRARGVISQASVAELSAWVAGLTEESHTKLLNAVSTSQTAVDPASIKVGKVVKLISDETAFKDAFSNTANSTRCGGYDTIESFLFEEFTKSDEMSDFGWDDSLKSILGTEQIVMHIVPEAVVILKKPIGGCFACPICLVESIDSSEVEVAGLTKGELAKLDKAVNDSYTCPDAVVKLVNVIRSSFSFLTEAVGEEHIVMSTHVDVLGAQAVGPLAALCDHLEGPFNADLLKRHDVEAFLVKHFDTLEEVLYVARDGTSMVRRFRKIGSRLLKLFELDEVRSLMKRNNAHFEKSFPEALQHMSSKLEKSDKQLAEKQERRNEKLHTLKGLAPLNIAQLHAVESSFPMASGFEAFTPIPILIDEDGEVLSWIKTFEECAKGGPAGGVRIIDMASDRFFREFESCIQFGITTIITGFDTALASCCQKWKVLCMGHIPSLVYEHPCECGQCLRIAEVLGVIAGWSFKGGGLQCVRLGDYIVELNPEWRRYILSNVSNVQMHPILDKMVKRIKFAACRILQLRAESHPNEDGVMELHCLDMGGSKVASISTNWESATVFDLFVQVAHELSLHWSDFELLLGADLCLRSQHICKPLKDLLPVPEL